MNQKYRRNQSFENEFIYERQAGTSGCATEDSALKKNDVAM